jgi:putative endonuclease
VSNVARGHQAERAAADYLRQRGYRIVALNWRRPRAEIDIIACLRHGPLLFIEVKFRRQTTQGSGLDYITPRKLAQMRFAAELWVAEQGYSGEYTLAALELTGPEFTVTQFLPEL